jgi:pyruvyltransferase
MVTTMSAGLLHPQNDAKMTFPLFWWKPEMGDNFGDALSPVIVEKMIKKTVRRSLSGERKLLAIGSIIQFAEDNDIIWGSGIGGRDLKGPFKFKNLDVRAVRGPLTRQFLLDHGIECPEVYGDPALLLPSLYPSFKRSKKPKYSYIIIPHISEMNQFKDNPHVVFPTEHWRQIVRKILDSQFVISGSLHGIVVAEAFGVPARLLKINLTERPFKYEDYYLGTGRPNFSYAKSIQEALEMGGESPPHIDLQMLIDSFPYEIIPVR